MSMEAAPAAMVMWPGAPRRAGPPAHRRTTNLAAMVAPTLDSVLADRPYPGRGCLLGRSGDGEVSVVYFVTGRSEASRARRLEVRDQGEVDVVATRTSGTPDALRHYRAVAHAKGWTVVGNGDHVAPLAEGLAGGGAAFELLAGMDAEPDPPIFTPRIWLAIDREGEHTPLFGYARRRADDGTDRTLWSVSDLAPHSGVLLTTYDGQREPVSKSTAPAEVSLRTSSASDCAEALWAGLQPDLRVGAVLVRPYRAERPTVLAG